ncbi:hypothetical protein ACHAXN_007581 [Cyclotella atomus]
MTIRSRAPLTTVGILAAAGSISSSDGAFSLSCTSSWDCSNNAAFVHRIPRGGSSAESTRATNAKDGENTKQHKRKKKRTKSEKNSNSSKEDAGSKSPGSEVGDETDETVLPPEISHILSTTCHYSVLSLPKTASQTEILKAYRKKCVLTHPDKLPKNVADRRGAFDKVAKAFEVLGCEKKRALYDKFGHADESMIDDSSAMGQMFGQDVFRDFFGSSSVFGDPFFGRSASAAGGGSAAGSNPFRRPPRNKDLRYNLEVTLEDLYTGTPKHVAIQQPNPLQPHFPLRKELEVNLTPGMMSGNSVRISGVVDSIPNCAPADVVFLLSERRHPVFTRRGSDLAMEVRISLGESLCGFRREVRCLDGNIVVIGPPKGEVLETRLEMEDASNGTAITDSSENENFIGNPTTYSTKKIQLSSTIIQTGDVHVLKGKGMPKQSTSSSKQYGDLYIQYVVEMPGSQNSKPSNVLSSGERVELARLLHKLEGKSDPCLEFNNSTEVEFLELASASDFGKSPPSDGSHDDYLQHEHEDEHEFHTNDINDFFQRAFGGRSATFGNFGNGGFHYHDHEVECSQM